MVLPLMNPQSLGSQIVNKLNQLKQNQLLGEQVTSAKQQNEVNPRLNQLKMQGLENENQLFPHQLRQKELANKLSEMELEQYKPKTEAETAYKNALINKMNFQQSNPLYGQPGVAGQIGAAQISNPEIAKIIMQSIGKTQDQRQAKADLDRKRAEGYTFNSLPMPERQYLLAQAAGMGIEPNEAAALFNKGKTISDMAKSQGYDANNLPEPVYPLTPAGQTQLKMRQAANAEIKVMGDKIAKAMAPYSRKILGYSPAQIAEAIQGKNPESQAKLLAARALQPELAAIRLRMGGGNVGIEAIREMTNTSMGHINALESLVSPNVYLKANQYVDDWLTEAVEAANKKATQGVEKKSSKNENNDPLGIR